MERTNIDNQTIDLGKKFEIIYNPSSEFKGYCPIRDILDRFGDKWSIYTILQLGQTDKMRFNELKSKISGISQRMLTVTLRSLEQDGLVERTIYPQIPPRVEYRLTPLGFSLLEQMVNLGEWASTHMDEIIKARERFATKTDSQLIQSN